MCEWLYEWEGKKYRGERERERERERDEKNMKL